MSTDMSRCAVSPARGRRIFWATQPDCATFEPCADRICGVPGLRRVPLGGNGAAIDNAEWVRGLAINIILTDAARTDTECGYRVGQRLGHWSDAFRGDGLSAGSTIRQVPATCSVNEGVALGEATLGAALHKLVTWQVAREVTVTGRYAGRNAFDFDVTIIGDANEVISIGMTGTRNANAWLWGTTA